MSGMYQDDNLLNTFLTLNKNGIYLVPIAKMQKYGVVESLIFYGQGGKNLDMLPMSMQMGNFKARLADFVEFYKINSDTIEQMLNQGEYHDDNIQHEGSDEEGDDDDNIQREGGDDETVYADAENESFISGEGLV